MRQTYHSLKLIFLPFAFYLYSYSLWLTVKNLIRKYKQFLMKYFIEQATFIKFTFLGIISGIQLNILYLDFNSSF